MNAQNENAYQELLSLWADLESGLGIILASPGSIQEFEPRVRQYDRWMQDLLQRDTDVGLYLLFQLATNSHAGYSASHALVCAVLCHLIATELKVAPLERDSLVHAALTMNIAMTALQDQLAGQLEKPSAEQQEAIREHALKGRRMLADRGVADALWLDIVAMHHDDSTDQGELHRIAPANRLARILRVVDRYAAMISPRKSREGRSAINSVRALIIDSPKKNDLIGHALVHVAGAFPPGTCVKLDNGEIAVVMRRSSKLNRPHVAIVASPKGELMAQPRLHRTANNKPGIQVALPASAVRGPLNHSLILELSVYAAQQP